MVCLIDFILSDVAFTRFEIARFNNLNGFLVRVISPGAGVIGS